MDTWPSNAGPSNFFGQINYAGPSSQVGRNPNPSNYVGSSYVPQPRVHDNINNNFWDDPNDRYYNKSREERRRAKKQEKTKRRAERKRNRVEAEASQIVASIQLLSLQDASSPRQDKGKGRRTTPASEPVAVASSPKDDEEERHDSEGDMVDGSEDDSEHDFANLHEVPTVKLKTKEEQPRTLNSSHKDEIRIHDPESSSTTFSPEIPTRSLRASGFKIKSINKIDPSREQCKAQYRSHARSCEYYFPRGDGTPLMCERHGVRCEYFADPRM